ncbi:MAG TPA: hypothetical protein VGT99_09745 [Gammaproteobacteria bacterium]|nr:hypothetical protein [Gammaproteobacteria bacterium]
MLRALALLFLAPLLVAAGSEARADGLAETAGQERAASLALFERGKAYPGEDPAILAGHERHGVVLALPVFVSGESYRLCLLYDYARSEQVDPISGTGFTSGGRGDAHNLGLGLHGLVSERLEFEAVLGHSHVDSSSNSAYAGVIYNVSGHMGLGADLGRISSTSLDDKRLRAFARFYF